MNMDQTQLRAFLGSVGLIAVILMTTATGLLSRPVTPAQSTSVVSAQS